MAFTLTLALQGMYRALGQSNTALATDGSTTTVQDSALAGIGKDNDRKNGAIFIVRDAGGANAAPEGEFAGVSGSTAATLLYTLNSTLTAAVASGDRYMYVSGYYPLQEMIGQLNAALRSLGDVPLVDTTTLDTETAKREYTASVIWKRRPPYRIDIQGKTGDSDDNDWIENNAWEYVPAAAGSTGLIIFRDQPIAGRDIRVWYQDSHPEISAYSDKINEILTPDLVIKAAVVEALTWQNDRLSGSDRSIIQRLNDAQNRLAAARAMYPVWKPKRNTKLATYHVETNPTGDWVC
jgi:hypothetical protein